MAESTALDALIAELLGDVGIIHDKIKEMPKSIAVHIQTAAEEMQIAAKEIELQTGANISAANNLKSQIEKIKEEAAESLNAIGRIEVAAASAEVRKAATVVLADTVKRVADEASGYIGKTIDSQLSANIAKLNEAEKKLSGSVAAFGWRWAAVAGGAAAGGILTVLLTAWLAVWWQRGEVTALQTKAAELQANIAAWEKMGVRAKPIMCGKDQTRRVCIRIDKSAGFFVDGDGNNDYAVIYGY